jgi:hypothetical protein
MEHQMTDTIPPVPPPQDTPGVPKQGIPRKRGGQPANTNALKYGVYSRYYTPEELLALDRDVAGSLKDELEILRLAIFDSAESILKEPEDDFPFHDLVSALRTIAVAIARLENIIQVRMTTFGDPDRREQQVDAMLERMEQDEMEAAAANDLVGPHIIPAGDIVPASSPHPLPSKKKSGAQPGNINAYKHGFYARGFSPSEKKMLRVDGSEQLRHEETLLRILILRTWRSMRAVRSSIAWQEYLYTLRSIGYAIFVIAKLQRARRRFFGDLTDLEKDIQLGIHDACADLGILDYFNTQVKK